MGHLRFFIKVTKIYQVKIGNPSFYVEIGDGEHWGAVGKANLLWSYSNLC